MRRWQVFVAALFVAVVACTGSDDVADTEQTVDTSIVAESRDTETARTEQTVDSSIVAESQDTETADTEQTVDSSIVAEPQDTETAETVVDRTGPLSCLPMDPDGWTQSDDLVEDDILKLEIAANDEMIVALGLAEDVVPRPGEVTTVTYHSSDGVAWEPGEGLWSEVSWIEAIAGDPHGFVVIGTDDQHVSWVAFSADGTSWERIDPESLPDPEEEPLLTDVHAGPDGFVIVGLVGPYVDPDLGFVPGGSRLWHSDDGRSWTAADLPSDWGPVAVSATETGWAALTIRDEYDESPAQVWASSDGLRWTEVDTDTGPPVVALGGLFPATGPLMVFDDTWVQALNVGGYPDRDDSGPGSPTVWVSTNGGVSWAQQTVWSEPDSPGFELFDAAMTDQGLFLSGFLLEPPELGGRFVHHSDDGVTWQHCFTSPLQLESIAAFGDGVVAYDAESGDVFTWHQP